MTFTFLAKSEGKEIHKNMVTVLLRFCVCVARVCVCAQGV